MKKSNVFILMVLSILFISSCTLLSEIGDDDEDHQALFDGLPTDVQTYLQTNYSGYEVEEVENDTLCDSTAIAGIEIELEDESNNIEEVELFFDNNDNFIYVSTEIDPSTLPVEVTNLIAQNYPTYEIDDEASKMTFASGTIWYEVEIEDNSADIELELTISSEWAILCVEVEED